MRVSRLQTARLLCYSFNLERKFFALWLTCGPFVRVGANRIPILFKFTSNTWPLVGVTTEGDCNASYYFTRWFKARVRSTRFYYANCRRYWPRFGAQYVSRPY
ncbi:hypothetical protein QWZ13_16245 [Reinekea marina]|uniref:hypothetical protein n=1 Tax=Reinekea marina TaxID=1310421 RepID=UPI0025B543D4|nr:hypothetical protein [Reinekea marina]MDN3650460.1 hypothetical protein [Reinekea marina]